MRAGMASSIWKAVSGDGVRAGMASSIWKAVSYPSKAGVHIERSTRVRALSEG